MHLSDIFALCELLVVLSPIQMSVSTNRKREEIFYLISDFAVSEMVGFIGGQVSLKCLVDLCMAE